MEIIEEFSPEKQKEIMAAAIDSGVGYIIPDKFKERYNTNGILTNTEYPNWTQHEYIAQCIRARNGNFYTIHPDFLNSQGLLDNVLPNILVRHIRENATINPDTRVINPSGISLFESPVWSALLPLLEKKDVINKAFVPGLLVRQKDDSFECAMEAKIRNEKLDILWTPLIKKEGEKPKLSWAPWDHKKQNEFDYENNFSLDAGKSSKWFIKGIHTSGSKAVGFLNEEQALVGQLKRFLRNKKEIFGDIFVLQPFIPSLMNIRGEKKRTKSDLFLLGNPEQRLKHISTSIMVSSMSAQKVHGGSNTQLIVCI